MLVFSCLSWTFRIDQISATLLLSSCRYLHSFRFLVSPTFPNVDIHRLVKEYHRPSINRALGFILSVSLRTNLCFLSQSIVSCFLVQFIQYICLLFIIICQWDCMLSNSHVVHLFSADADANIYIHSSEHNLSSSAAMNRTEENKACLSVGLLTWSSTYDLSCMFLFLQSILYEFI